jgi:hypothetical protein
VREAARTSGASARAWVDGAMVTLATDAGRPGSAAVGALQQVVTQSH